jgi:putative tricarboxylic transport membrane protein
MQKNDRLTSLVLAVFGLYIAFEGYRLGLGTLYKPKAGFLVFWVGMILAGLSIALFVKTFSPSRGEKKNLWKGVRWTAGLKLIGALLVYVLIFKWLGFILSTTLLLLFLFKALEPRRWTTALLFSLVTTVLCYLIFGVFLELQFPDGVLGVIYRQF